MRKIGLFSLVLVFSTVACGFFTRSEEGEPDPASQATDPPRPTEVIEATIVPEPTEVVESSQPTKSPEKDKEITPKPTREAGDPIPVETPVAEGPAGDLPENVTEVFYPYTVREYEGGVEIEVTQFRIFETSYLEYEWLLGVLTNTGTVNLYNITIHILAVDEHGEELLRSFTSVDMVDFPVGAKTAFSMPFRGDGIPEGTDHLRILFDGRERWEGTNLTQEYDVLSASGVLEEDGDYFLTVGFQSTGDWPTREVAIGAILYNQQGRIVGRCESGFSEWGDAHLKAGGTASITRICSPIYGAVDHYDITVEGHEMYD